jgi:hypothetical protein
MGIIDGPFEHYFLPAWHINAENLHSLIFFEYREKGPTHRKGRISNE